MTLRSERRYTCGGQVAHLLDFGTDYTAYPYTAAHCGYSPEWPNAWLGSGNQDEYDEANRRPVCKRCSGVVRQLQRACLTPTPAS